MQNQDTKKCKWCGQNIHHELDIGNYCTKTCVIAAIKEDPKRLKQLQIRRISTVAGAFYPLLLYFIDGKLSSNTILFTASIGALVGWFIGVGLGWGLYVLNKQQEKKQEADS